MAIGLKRTLTNDQFQKIVTIAREKYGISLTESKRQLTTTRILKRLECLNIETFDEYLKLLDLSDNTEESNGFVGALTTNVTHFFREPHHFEIIREEVSNRIRKLIESGQKFRIWSAGCSSGQETYSLAITLFDEFPEIENYDVKILATDLDPIVLAKAKAAKYSTREIEGIERRLLDKHFEKDRDHYVVKKSIRDIVSFGNLNLLENYPMTGKFDIVFCRNVTIYFDKGIQEIVWSKIHDCLTNEGLLFIGHSERLSEEVSKCVDSIGITAFRKNASNI